MHTLVAVVLFIIALALGVSVAQQTNITSFRYAGIDLLMLDSPSWVTHLQRGYHADHEFLVFGETTPRTIREESFESLIALPVETQWAYAMQDLHTFYAPNTSIEWTIGVTNYGKDMDSAFQGATGVYLPLIVMKPTGAQWIQPTNDVITNISWNGAQFAAVRVDASDMGDIQAYYAGWWTDCTTYKVNFMLVRTHYNSTQSGGVNQARFTYDPTLDTATFYSNNFATYSPTFRPWVHLINNWGPQLTLVIVFDPNSRAVYAGTFTGAGYTSQWKTDFTFPNHDLVSSECNIAAGICYVGFAASGNLSGQVIPIDITNGNTLSPIILPPYCSNPKALVVGHDSSLYIALNGYNEVLRYYADQFSYQRLPDWLTRTWVGVDGTFHVYFATNEEHSKVYRVWKGDFCPQRCPFMGYCSNGECACSEGFGMKNGACELLEQIKYEDKGKREHGGEIALGILFMFSTLAAIPAWYLYYRQRGNRFAPDPTYAPL